MVDPRPAALHAHPLIRIGLAGIVAMAQAGPALEPLDQPPGGPAIHAFQVPDGSIRIDGRLDSAWVGVAALPGAVATIDLADTAHITLTGGRKSRSAGPGDPGPEPGRASLMAAFDRHYLYFYFHLRSAPVPDRPGYATPLPYSGNGFDLFLDPQPWTADTADLKTHFPAAEAGDGFGPYAIAFDIPLDPSDTGYGVHGSAMGGQSTQAATDWAAGALFPLAPGDTGARVAKRSGPGGVTVELRLAYGNWRTGRPWPAGDGDFRPRGSASIAWGVTRTLPDSPGYCGGAEAIHGWYRAKWREPGWCVATFICHENALNRDTLVAYPTAGQEAWSPLAFVAEAVAPGDPATGAAACLDAEAACPGAGAAKPRRSAHGLSHALPALPGFYRHGEAWRGADGRQVAPRAR